MKGRWAARLRFFVVWLSFTFYCRLLINTVQWANTLNVFYSETVFMLITTCGQHCNAVIDSLLCFILRKELLTQTSFTFFRSRSKFLEGHNPRIFGEYLSRIFLDSPDIHLSKCVKIFIVATKCIKVLLEMERRYACWPRHKDYYSRLFAAFILWMDIATVSVLIISAVKGG